MKEPATMLSANTARRAVAAGIGTGAIAGALMAGAGATASADPLGCTAADLARVSSGVSFDTSNYLYDHPDVNAFFTGLKGRPRSEIADDVQNWLDANPLVRGDLQGIRQPMVDFRNQCNAPNPAPLIPGGTGQ
jgi:heme-binding protein